MVKLLNNLLKIFLFLLPWQTIYVYRWGVLNNVKWEYGTLGFYGTEILLWVIVILFIVWYWKEKKLRNLEIKKFSLTKDRIFVFVCLSFISYLFISIAWSADRSLALQQSLRVLEAFLLFFILFLGPLDSKSATKWFVAGAILPAVLGIWQFLTQSTFAFKWLGIVSHPVWEAGTSVIQSDAIGRWLRAYGSFSHPNVFGGYLAVALLMLLLNHKSQITNHKLHILLITLLFTALFLTFSRSAWAMLIISLLVYLIICLKRKCLSSIFYLLSMFIILSVIFWPIVSTRLFQQSTNEVQSIEQRVGGYAEAWQIFKQHPLLGVGAGNYTLAARELNPNRPGWEYQPAHNVFLLFLAEFGVIGVSLFLLVLYTFINFQFPISNFQLWYFLFFISYFLLLFFDHYLYSSYIGLILTAVFFAVFARFNAHHLHS